MNGESSLGIQVAIYLRLVHRSTEHVNSTFGHYIVTMKISASDANNEDDVDESLLYQRRIIL